MNRLSLKAGVCLFVLGSICPFAIHAGEFLATTAPTIPQQYIVVLDHSPGKALEKIQPQIAMMLSRKKVSVTAVWDTALNGFVATGIDEKTAKEIAALPGVISVEPDGIAYPDAIQYNPPVGLDAIDQRGGAFSGSYTYNYTAPLAHAYVIDTGVRLTHVDFGGRAQSDGNFTGDNCGGSGDISPGGLGHGTGVASVIGGATYGVAKQIRIHSLRIYNCQNIGGASNAISALNWIVQYGLHPGVVNISSNFLPSPALDAAINAAVSANFFVAVSAGNRASSTIEGFDDACSTSPARVPNAFTVAAPAIFSARGTCVDMFAPGAGIAVAAASSDTAVTSGVGTSYSAPHAAGVAALILQSFPALDVKKITWEVIARSTKNIFVESPAFHLYGSPNRWLYSLPLPYSTIPTVPDTVTVERCNTTTSIYWTAGPFNSTNTPTYYELWKSTDPTFTTAVVKIEGLYRDNGGGVLVGQSHSPTMPLIYAKAKSCNSFGCSLLSGIKIINGCGGHQ